MTGWPTWACGHERTELNTVGRTSARCRICNAARHRANRASASPAERRLAYRVRFLPQQIEAAERKLAMLRQEAASLGLRDLAGGQA